MHRGVAWQRGADTTHRAGDASDGVGRNSVDFLGRGATPARGCGRLVVALQGAWCVRRLLELTDADHSLELADDAAASQNGRGPDRT